MTDAAPPPATNGGPDAARSAQWLRGRGPGALRVGTPLHDPGRGPLRVPLGVLLTLGVLVELPAAGWPPWRVFLAALALIAVTAADVALARPRGRAGRRRRGTVGGLRAYEGVALVGAPPARSSTNKPRSVPPRST